MTIEELRTSAMQMIELAKHEPTDLMHAMNTINGFSALTYLMVKALDAKIPPLTDEIARRAWDAYASLIVMDAYGRTDAPAYDQVRAALEAVWPK